MGSEMCIRDSIKSKRARFGVKCFSLNARNGFTFDVELYLGADTPSGEWCRDLDSVNHVSMSEQIVVELLHRNDFLNEGRQVTVDNWFCSLPLSQFLLMKRTLIVGTIRSNRGVPEGLRSFKMQATSTEFVRNGDVLLTKFVDKREVYLLSTAHVAELEERSRRVRGGDEVRLMKPNVIQEYNATMDGTDEADAMQHSVVCVRKSYAWNKKL